MEVPEVPKPRTELVQRLPQIRNDVQEIDQIFNHIERIAAILKEHYEVIETLKLTVTDNKKEVLTLATPLETFKKKIDALEIHTEEIQTLHEQLLDLKTKYKTTKSKLTLKNTTYEERLKALEERAYNINNETLKVCEAQKNELKNLNGNFTILQKENIVLKSRLKFFGTMSTIGLVGLVLVFWIWFDSYRGSSKRA